MRYVFDNFSRVTRYLSNLFYNYGIVAPSGTTSHSTKVQQEAFSEGAKIAMRLKA
jgi:hypothetical protein